MAFCSVPHGRHPLQHHCAAVVDRQVAEKGQFQVIATQIGRRIEKGGQQAAVEGEGGKDVRRQADTDGERDAGACVHQPEERRQSGRQADAEVPVSAESAPGVRLDAGRTEFRVSDKGGCQTDARDALRSAYPFRCGM